MGSTPAEPDDRRTSSIDDAAGHGAETPNDERTLVHSQGVVRRSLANDLFDVQLPDGRRVVAHLSAAARLQATRVGAGDRVRVALARYDHTRGRIVGRM